MTANGHGIDDHMFLGRHVAVYHAKPSNGEIIFTKARQTKAIENADQVQTKVGRLSGYRMLSKFSKAID